MNYKTRFKFGVAALMKIWLLTLVVALFSGCAGLTSRLDPPAVTISDFSVGNAGLFEQQFNLTLRIQNPNAEELRIDGIAFDLEINDQAFAKGVGNQTVIVPRYGSAVMPVEAVSSLGGLVTQIMALARAGRPGFEYRIKGKLSLNGASVSFDRRGGLDWDMFGAKT